MILLFNINIIKQSSITSLCREMGIDVHISKKEDFNKTVGEIAGMANSSYQSIPKPVPFKDEMIVFCGMDPDMVEAFLLQYHLREIEPVALKAVMTKYNTSWTPGRLCAELKKEHEAIHRKPDRDLSEKIQ